MLGIVRICTGKLRLSVGSQCVFCVQISICSVAVVSPGVINPNCCWNPFPPTSYFLQGTQEKYTCIFSIEIKDWILWWVWLEYWPFKQSIKNRSCVVFPSIFHSSGGPVRPWWQYSKPFLYLLPQLATQILGWTCQGATWEWPLWCGPWDCHYH